MEYRFSDTIEIERSIYLFTFYFIFAKRLPKIDNYLKYIHLIRFIHAPTFSQKIPKPNIIAQNLIVFRRKLFFVIDILSDLVTIGNQMEKPMSVIAFGTEIHSNGIEKRNAKEKKKTNRDS